MTKNSAVQAAGASLAPAFNVPLFDLKRQQVKLHERIGARLDGVLDHCQFVFGPEVEELERNLADFCGAKHAIGVSSGRDALIMALMALGIGAGDAVFVPAFTFSATAGSVAAVGATPVFVDVDADSFNMSVADLERAVAEVEERGVLSPKVVMPVDLYGQAADYARIGEIAAAHGMTVVADSAQSFGGSVGNRKIGTLGQITATSFYPTKPLGGYGDGGALFTDDDKLADEIRLIRTHGRQGSGDEALRLGMTARLDTLQAAVLLVKLEEFAADLAARRRIAQTYEAELGGLVTTPKIGEGRESAWALYTLRVNDRDGLRDKLAAAGVGTGLFYPLPLHRHAAFAPYVTGEEKLPASEKLAGEVLSLPIFADLGEEEIAHVIAQVKQAV
jgi:dTDP-4-amino-4,6-dideoxygalactose transaminase